MNIQEFNDEFDIQYDSIAGKSAPGLDAYEKSVYLTRAQLELVKNYYNPKSNAKQEGFELTEKRRVDLNSIVTTFSTSEKSTSLDSINKNGRFIDLPIDVLYIVHEHLNAKVNGCDEKVTIVPLTHDEYNVQVNNPFKRPSAKRGWRLDIESNNEGRRVEIIYVNDNYSYFVRYIRYPEPIILVNLDDEFKGEGLSIDGFTNSNECKLNIELHPEILNRAVELAMGDYTKDNLESKIQLNSRNE